MLIKLQLTIAGLFDDFTSREDGQTMVEYGLLLALVAIVVALALTPLGKTVSDLITNVVSQL